LPTFLKNDTLILLLTINQSFALTNIMPETKITIYSTPYCGYCKMVKQYLDEHKIGYTDIDVMVDEKAAQYMVEKTKQQGVPVTIIEKDGQENIIIGFNKAELAKILNINN